MVASELTLIHPTQFTDLTQSGKSNWLMCHLGADFCDRINSFRRPTLPDLIFHGDDTLGKHADSRTDAPRACT